MSATDIDLLETCHASTHNVTTFQTLTTSDIETNIDSQSKLVLIAEV